MINVDYKIIRDEGDEKKIYKPDAIPSKLENIVYIEGPNSSGKSTLLNIIALGFYGDRNTSLNIALIDKLKGLASSMHQSLTFNLEVTNEDGSLKLVSEKKDPNQPNIVVKEISRERGERKLSREAFEREYNLIYDIPDNPTGRLSQLIFDIRSEQVRYGNSIGALKETSRRMISEIRGARDPERIQSLEEQVEKYRQELLVNGNHLENLKQNLDMTESYSYFQLYHEYSNKHLQLRNKIDDLIKKAGKVQRRVVRGNSEFKKALATAQRIIQEMKAIFDVVTALLSTVLDDKQKYLIKIWEKIDLSSALSDLQFDDQLVQSLVHFRKLVDEKQDDIDTNASFREVDLYHSLIKMLDNYKDINISIPGLKKSIKEFIIDLKSAAEKHNSLAKFKDNVNELSFELGKLTERFNGLNNNTFPLLMQLKKSLPAHEQEATEILQDQEHEELSREIEQCKERLDYFETKYAAKGKPSEESIEKKWPEALKNLSFYKEDQLLEEITSIEKAIITEKTNQKGIDHKLHSLNSELERLKDRKPHKYQNKLGFLEELYLKLPLLEDKLMREYKSYVTDIIQRKPPADNNKEQNRYNEAVFVFLADKIGRFRHIDQEYTAMKVDLIEGVIFTDTKKNIHLQDMGTGQGQGAYLKGKLNTSDNRKIIALFDEVAMMDNKSLEPIYAKFQEQYKEGKLLVGVVVQRGEDVKIIAKGR